MMFKFIIRRKHFQTCKQKELNKQEDEKQSKKKFFLAWVSHKGPRHLAAFTKELDEVENGFSFLDSI